LRIEEESRIGMDVCDKKMVRDRGSEPPSVREFLR
jgi:hypothetical protein